jgi:hypothetical protein
LLASTAHAQGPQADASLPLFTVIAAAVAADTNGAVYTSPLAQQLRKDLAGKEIPSLDDIRRFLVLNKADYTRLVSFALVIDGPPDFAFRYREVDLPLDAQNLVGLNTMLAAFYNEAHIEELWTKYHPQYEAQAAIYDESLARVMLTVNGYLRTPSSGFYGRNFSVVIDMLGPPNEVNARSFETNYYVVVTASPQLRTDEVRHGYLHYILEPLAAKESIIVRSKEKLQDSAKGIGVLDRGLRRSFPLFMSESLVRAVELRMTGLSKKMNAEELNRRITDAASDGLFLVPYFVEALLKFEAQDSGMRIYYPQMIEKIDVPREEKRASQITYRTTPAQRSLSEFSESRQASASTDDLESLLAEGEDAMARHDIIEARKAYRAALDAVANAGANTDPQLNASGRARALYGLALAATEAKQAEVAKTFFQQTLEVAREPQLLAWSHIYLGRLLDMENHRDQALRHYRQALESGDIAPNVRLAAQKGLETQFTKPKEN